MELVQIYLKKKKLDEVAGISNFLAFFQFLVTNLPSWIWILKLNVDLDLGGKMNADPDPQPWDYHEIKEIQKICTQKTVLWIRFRMAIKEIQKVCTQKTVLWIRFRMAIKEIQKICTQKTVLWIRFRMDLELLSESGSSKIWKNR